MDLPREEDFIPDYEEREDVPPPRRVTVEASGPRVEVHRARRGRSRGGSTALVTRGRENNGEGVGFSNPEATKPV